MNVKEITVSYMHTKNLGNFENVKVEAGVTITAIPGEDIDKLYDRAYASMKKQVKKGLQEAQAQGGF